MAWLLAGLPLLLLGVFTPALTLLVSVPVAAVLMLAGLRWTPGLSQEPGPAQVSGLTGHRTAATPGPGQTRDQGDGATAARTPWWAVIAVLVIAAAFGLDQMIYHAQQLIVMRDPAAYIQFGKLDSRPRLTADPPGPGGLRGHPPRADLRQLRLLSNRRRGGAAVHGRAADDPGRAAWIGGAAAARRWPRFWALRRAHLRRADRPACRAAVGTAGRARLADRAADAVHQPVDVQRAGAADPLPRRALGLVTIRSGPEGRARRGHRRARRAGPRPDPAGPHRRGQRHSPGHPLHRAAAHQPPAQALPLLGGLAGGGSTAPWTAWCCRIPTWPASRPR